MEEQGRNLDSCLDMPILWYKWNSTRILSFWTLGIHGELLNGEETGVMNLSCGQTRWSKYLNPFLISMMEGSGCAGKISLSNIQESQFALLNHGSIWGWKENSYGLRRKRSQSKTGSFLISAILLIDRSHIDQSVLENYWKAFFSSIYYSFNR